MQTCKTTATTLLTDLRTEADIIQLVDALYARVNADELLRPIFHDIARSLASPSAQNARFLEQHATGHQPV